MSPSRAKGEAMNFKKIQRGKWYRTKQGDGQAEAVGGTYPPSVRVRLSGSLEGIFRRGPHFVLVLANFFVNLQHVFFTIANLQHTGLTLALSATWPCLLT
jgi:hypothetical protein